MTRILAWVAPTLLSVVVLTDHARAAVPVAPQAAAMVAATPAVKETTGLAKDVAAIPLDVIDVLRLPLGVVQVAACPLPEISAADGFRNIGKGLVAPFYLVFDILKLPYETVNHVGGLAEAGGLPVK